MALSLSCLSFHAKHRLLNRKASSGPPYRPESIARVHVAIAWSPEALPQVSKSSAAAGIAANETVDAKARAASVHRRIGVIRMVLHTGLGSATLSDPTASHSWFLVANT